MAKVDVKKLKFKTGKFGRKKGRRFEFSGFAYEKRVFEPKADVHEFENLGLRIEIIGKKIVVSRNGTKEVFEDENELMVPSKKGVQKRSEEQRKPNAVFFERRGVRYYFFPEIGVVVRNCLTYWNAEVHPPENLFGSASREEFAESLKELINSGHVNERAEREYREMKEIMWRRNVQRAVRRAIEIIARKYGYEVPPRNVPVSQSVIEELRERGFEVRLKVKT